MKTQNMKVIATFAFAATILFAGCKKDEEEENVPVTISQSELDAASNYIKDATGGFAHGGPDEISPDSTIREVFSNQTSLTGEIPPGTIITKNTYKKGPDGNKTDTLFVSFAMVKREPGYDAANQDWEYMMMPFDNSVDYSAHPYGMLPPEGSDMRGAMESCVGCHSSADGGDYLFSND